MWDSHISVSRKAWVAFGCGYSHVALDFKCSADLKRTNAVREEGQEQKPPSQCKQAVAQRSDTVKTENFSSLETKQEGTAQTLQTSFSLKTIARFRRKGLFFSSRFFIQRVSFQTNAFSTFSKDNLSYFVFGPSLKNTENPLMLRKNLSPMGKKKTCCLFKKKESQLGAAISENAIQIGGLVEIPHGILCTV